jgi:DNA-binding transcriptional ArsR family regulator
MFRAFSDPTRLRILYLLLDGELCVGDLVKILKAPQFKASQGQVQQQTDSPVENHERIAESPFDLFGSSFEGSGIGHSQVHGQIAAQTWSSSASMQFEIPQTAAH